VVEWLLSYNLCDCFVWVMYGNLFVVFEVVVVVSDDRLVGWLGVGELLLLSCLILYVFEQWIGVLLEFVCYVLLLVVVGEFESVYVVFIVVGCLELLLDVFVEVEWVGAIAVEDDRVCFCYLFLCLFVYCGAPVEQCRCLYGVLVGCLIVVLGIESECRAWYLAVAAVVFDEEVVGAFAVVGECFAYCIGYFVVVYVYECVVEFMFDFGCCGECLVEVVEVMCLVGWFVRVCELLCDVVELLIDDVLRVDIVFKEVMFEVWLGLVEVVVECYVCLVDEVIDFDCAAQVLLYVAVVVIVVGDIDMVLVSVCCVVEFLDDIFGYIVCMVCEMFGVVFVLCGELVEGVLLLCVVVEWFEVEGEMFGCDYVV